MVGLANFMLQGLQVRVQWDMPFTVGPQLFVGREFVEATLDYKFFFKVFVEVSLTRGGSLVQTR